MEHGNIPVGLILPYVLTESVIFICYTMMIGGEVCEHGTIDTGSVSGLIQVDDDSHPHLEPTPLANRFCQHILQGLLGFVSLFSFPYLIRAESAQMLNDVSV